MRQMFDLIIVFAAMGGMMTLMALPFVLLGGVISYCVKEVKGMTSGTTRKD